MLNTERQNPRKRTDNFINLVNSEPREKIDHARDFVLARDNHVGEPFQNAGHGGVRKGEIGFERVEFGGELEGVEVELGGREEEV